MPTPPEPIRDDLAVITCLFAPQPHERRRLNFARFRAQFGRDLFVAECGFGGGEWSMEAGPNCLRFHAEARHVMWQKERLLNAMVRRLPPHIAYVAWVDADVLFPDRVV